MRATTPSASQHYREDRRAPVTSGDLHQRLERKTAAIEVERRCAARRQTDLIGSGEGERTPLHGSPDPLPWQHETVSERLRLLSDYGIT